MPDFVDGFGSLVTANADGSWTRGWTTVGPCDMATAELHFSSTAPDPVEMSGSEDLV